jgi:hypothetical protein
MRSQKPRVRYKVSKPLPAVKLEEHPGSTLRNPTGVLIEIPADVVIELEGTVARSGLINILWQSEAFSVFYDDLQEKAQILGTAE